jgi:hypothetical protein
VGKAWPVHKSDNLTAICETIVKKIRELRHFTVIWASAACYKDSITFFFTYNLRQSCLITFVFICIVSDFVNFLKSAGIWYFIQYVIDTSCITVLGAPQNISQWWWRKLHHIWFSQEDSNKKTISSLNSCLWWTSPGPIKYFFSPCCLWDLVLSNTGPT